MITRYIKLNLQKLNLVWNKLLDYNPITMKLYINNRQAIKLSDIQLSIKFTLSILSNCMICTYYYVTVDLLSKITM